MTRQECYVEIYRQIAAREAETGEDLTEEEEESTPSDVGPGDFEDEEIEDVVEEVEEEWSPMPSHFEAWVDEDGVKVWRDKNTGRTLNSNAVRNPLSDPYTSWVKVIDASGRVLYVREDTGEAAGPSDASKRPLHLVLWTCSSLCSS